MFSPRPRLETRALPLAVAAAVALAGSAARAQIPSDPVGGPYKELCSACHGENLEGAPRGTPLAGVELRHGASIDVIARSTAEGFPDAGMPAWREATDEQQIRRIALYVAERRAGLTYTDFNVDPAPPLPEGAIASEAHEFRVELVADGLDRLPYSISPMPDGRILVTEKARALRIVSPDGTLSEPVRGTPPAFDDGFEVPGLRIVYGLGYLLDVALHPDYAENGWIYLSYTERCSGCNE